MANENANNIERKDEQTKKRIGKQRIIAACVLVILGIAVGLYANNASKYQSTDDAYVEAHMVQVAPKVTGQIIELNVEDNQRIKEGDVVAVIDKDDYRIRFEQADADYQKELANQKVAKANFSAVQSEIACCFKANFRQRSNPLRFSFSKKNNSRRIDFVKRTK